MSEVAISLPATEPPTWECADCGERIVLTDPELMDDADTHWKRCEKPNALALQRRRRLGLDPGVVPLSSSALTTYEECPRQAWHGYVDPKRPLIGGGAPAELGHALHTALETGSDDPPPTLPVELEEDWNWMLPRARRMVAEAESEDPRPHVTYTELEILWEYELGDGRRAQCRAFIDRLLVFTDMSFVVIDYKSGRVVPSWDDLQGDTQLQMYLVAARRWHPGLRSGRGKQLQLREGKAPSLPKEGWLSPERIDRLEKLLIAKIERFAGEKTWRATPGKHCIKHCDFAHRCPAGREFLGEGIEIVAPASTLLFGGLRQVADGFAALEVAKAKLALLEAALKKAVKLSQGDGDEQVALGPTILDDGRILRWIQKSSPGIRSPQNVLEAARRTRAAGQDVSPFMHWDNGKRQPEGVELDDLMEDKLYPDFGAWTPQTIKKAQEKAREARARIEAQEKAALAAKEAS